MLIREIMTENPRSHTRDDNVLTLARCMRDHRVGAVPIVENEKIVGIVTDRDIVLRVVAEGADPERTQAGNIMTRQPVTVLDDTPVEDVADRMEEHLIRRIVVVDTTGRARGIVSLGDLARHPDKETKSEEVLEKVCSAP